MVCWPRPHSQPRWPWRCWRRRAVGLPLAVRPLFTERDLRVRTHVGALSRFYLATLLGLVAVRTHGAERAVQREHESLLAEWASAGFHLQRTVVAVEGVQSLLGFGLAAWLLLGYLAGGAPPVGCCCPIRPRPHRVCASRWRE
jgi:hypothetical protein